jgi:hypothetical protein
MTDSSKKVLSRDRFSENVKFHVTYLRCAQILAVWSLGSTIGRHCNENPLNVTHFWYSTVIYRCK